MSKHTPGPWTLYEKENGFCIESDFYIADVHKWHGIYKKEEMSQANAHLIAAAPELLEELEVLLGNIKVWGPEMNGFRKNCAHRIERAMSVIKKAKGEL